MGSVDGVLGVCGSFRAPRPLPWKLLALSRLTIGFPAPPNLKLLLINQIHSQVYLKYVSFEVKIVHNLLVLVHYDNKGVQELIFSYEHPVVLGVCLSNCSFFSARIWVHTGCLIQGLVISQK